MDYRGKHWNFTMIEMVVVIVILATLAAVATPMYFNHVKNSRKSAAKLQYQLSHGHGFHRQV